MVLQFNRGGTQMTRLCQACKAQLFEVPGGRKCPTCTYIIPKPDKLTTKTVIFWSTTHERLEDEYGKKINAMSAKSIRFIEEKCLDYSKESKHFFCKPLKGYNKTTYTMKALKGGFFECDCQGYVTKRRARDKFFEEENPAGNPPPQPTCSHIIALFLAFKLRYFLEDKDDNN